MDRNKFKEVFSDKEFVNRLLSLETGERVMKALAEKGIVLKPEEMDEFAGFLIAALECKCAYKEKEVENASGGVKMDMDCPNDAQYAAELLAGYIKSNSVDFSENKGSWILKNFVPDVKQF